MSRLLQACHSQVTSHDVNEQKKKKEHSLCISIVIVFCLRKLRIGFGVASIMASFLNANARLEIRFRCRVRAHIILSTRCGCISCGNCSSWTSIGVKDILQVTAEVRYCHRRLGVIPRCFSGRPSVVVI